MLVLTGCASHSFVKSELKYDYISPAAYPLTSKHKAIHVSIDDQTLARPEPTLKVETLKLHYSRIALSAQLIVYIHIQPSFLVQREPISRQIVEFDDNNKGTIKYVMTNRGYIRTPYSIELVDTLNETLIFHTQGADNYPIDAVPRPDYTQTTHQLLQAFRQNTKLARQTLLEDIWQKLKGPYLKDIQVSLGETTFTLVSEHNREPIFQQAFSLLKKNDKSAAKQALALYNQAYKRYEKKEDDESKQILEFINDGITAAVQITNDPNPQRYQ